MLLDMCTKIESRVDDVTRIYRNFWWAGIKESFNNFDIFTGVFRYASFILRRLEDRGLGVVMESEVDQPIKSGCDAKQLPDAMFTVF